MPKFTTGNDVIGRVSWDVEPTWQQRKTIFEQDAVMDAGEFGLQVDTTKTLQAVWPAIGGWDRPEAFTEEAFWALPMAHLHTLALLVGTWLWSGVNASEGEENPLVGQSAESE